VYFLFTGSFSFYAFFFLITVITAPAEMSRITAITAILHGGRKLSAESETLVSEEISEISDSSSVAINSR